MRTIVKVKPDFGQTEAVAFAPAATTVGSDEAIMEEVSAPSDSTMESSGVARNIRDWAAFSSLLDLV